MNETEQEVITCLTEMSECMRPHDQWWLGKLQQASTSARSIFKPEVRLAERYDFVRSVFSYYEGGMGGLHEMTPQECGQVKTSLYEATQALLRAYWKELGREWHVYSRFEIIPNGTRVRLIPNKVIYQRPDYAPTIVEDTEEVVSQIWSVVNAEGPDITNMPSYLIKCIQGGASWRSARHEALLVIGETGSL